MKGASYNLETILGGPYLIFLEQDNFDMKFNTYVKLF